MKNWLSVMFNTSFWTMLNPLSIEWDTILRNQMKHHKFEKIDNHSARIGDIIVWTASHPYASFSPISPINMKIRPTRRTVLAAHKKLVNDLFGNATEVRETP